MAKIKTFIENKEKFKTSDISDIKTPRAAAIIWNYKYRLGSRTVTDPTAQEAYDKIMDIQKRIILTKSIRSIETQKSKGTSEGKFSMILAPTKNWCAELTLGSWICIMMTPKRKITRADLDRANPNLIKFIGIIDTVSCDVSVNNAGHRTTTYKIEGPDWSACFNDVVYIDPAFRTWAEDNSAMSQLSFLRSKQLGNGIAQSNFTTDNNIDMITHIWRSTPIYDNKNNIEEGREDKSRKSQLNAIQSDVYATGTNIFSIPKEVVNFMGWELKPGKFQEIAQHVDIKMGKIDKNGKYDNQRGWPYKILKIWQPGNVFGNFTAWQLYKGVSAENIEEVFNDLYFEKSEEIETTKKENIMADVYSGDTDIRSNKLTGDIGNKIKNKLGVTIGTKSVTSITNTPPSFKFTLFNRIMPFYIRDPQKAERFYKEGATRKYSLYVPDLSLNMPQFGSSLTKPSSYSFSEPPMSMKKVTVSENNSRDNFNREILNTFASMYCNVPKTEIRLNDVMGVSYYVSSKHRINLLEVVLGDTIMGDEEVKKYVNILKNRTQEWEHPNLFSRDGLRNAMFKIDHFPVSEVYLTKLSRGVNIPPPTKKSDIKTPSKKSLEVGFKTKQAEKEIKDSLKKQTEDGLKGAVEKIKSYIFGDK